MAEPEVNNSLGAEAPAASQHNPQSARPRPSGPTSEDAGAPDAASSESPQDDAGIAQAEIDALVSGGGGPSPMAADAAGDDAFNSEDHRVLSSVAGEERDSEMSVDPAAPAERSGPRVAPGAGAAARRAAASAAPASTFATTAGRPLTLPDLGTDKPRAAASGKIDMLMDVNLRVKIELGRTRMLVEDVLKLNEGSVVELDKLAGDPVDVYVNDRLIARGEVLVLNDNFCVRVSEVISRDPHRVGSA